MNKPIEDMTKDEKLQELKEIVMSMTEDEAFAFSMWVDKVEGCDIATTEFEKLPPERKESVLKLFNKCEAVYAEKVEAKVKQEQAE